MTTPAQRLGQALNRFFFEPTSPATLGIFRILIGTVAFLSTLGRLPCRETFYSDRGIVSYQTMSIFYSDNWLLWFRWLPDTDPGLLGFFVGLLAVTFCFIIGFQTRIASVLLCVGMYTLVNRNLFIENCGDDLLRIACFWMMFAPAGAAYSVDRWLRVRRGLESPELVKRSPWAQRMLQLQLSYLYIQTALLKLPGGSWQDGTAMYYALNYLELKRFDFMKYFFYYLWQIKLATWGVLVAELSAGTLIWWRRTRYWMILAALGLHEGINLTMQFPVFQYVMMAYLVNFVYPDDMERVITKALTWRQARTSGPAAPRAEAA